MNAIPDGSGIYRIVCNITGKFYIGSSKNLRRRYQSHFGELRRNAHPNANLQRAFNKYGEDVFIFEVLELVLQPFLLEREQYWIDKLEAAKKGFNIDKFAGSTRLGHTFSPESREKMRLSHLGQVSPNKGKKALPGTIEKMIAAKKGKPSARLGATLSPETRAKISAGKLGKPNPHTGVPRTPEARAKIAAAGIGREFSAEAKAKIGTKMQGNTRGAKDYILTSPEGIEYEVHHLTAFCQEHNLSQQALSRVVTGNRKHHKGWIARYAPEAG